MVTVYDETEEKFDNYSLEIEELSYNDVEVDVVDDDGEVVESFDSPDDVIEDTYDGQAAVVVVVTGITVGTLITAILEAAACIAIAGVIYYGAKAAVKAIEKSSSKQKYYYKAYIYDKNVFIAIKNSISKASAVSRIKSGLNVYTYTASLAKSAVTATGLGCSSKDISDLSGKIRFWHYHTVPKNKSHIFFGLPVTY
ncbi:MAG: hypothetical protein ACRC7V_11065 [Lachnospiraceae bacterium]